MEDDRKDEAAAYRERAQDLIWIADMVTRDDARKILYQTAAEYRDRACQLEEIINAEEAARAAAKAAGPVQVIPSKWTRQPKLAGDKRG